MLSTHGRTGELFAFTLWTLPLGLIVGQYGKRPRFVRRSPLLRALLGAFIGVLAGVGVTLAGGVLIGGWMLTWDFPVFYCWSIAGCVGVLAALVTDGSIRLPQATVGCVLAMLPFAAMAWSSLQPNPAVIIRFAHDPARDAADFAMDSLLTDPHPTGRGRHLRWEERMQTRWTGADSSSNLLIVLYRSADRDAIRAALKGYRYVSSIRDTVIPP